MMKYYSIFIVFWIVYGILCPKERASHGKQARRMTERTLAVEHAIQCHSEPAG
jgi:hypothetical protein